MCGIGGFIGHATQPTLTYELMSKLFANLDIRGVDAAGVWGTEAGRNGKILYHKAPIRSSDFVDSPFWRLVGEHNINLLLAHARGATRGMGHPSCNRNNHPFVSQDKRMALVHNGMIHEANNLKKQYQTLSECDSEILLRIYEAVAEDRHQWFQGVKEIWSVIRQGHMAVAIGERHDNNERTLCLFRNDKRPLWIADLREDLGQVFFFSSLEIWEKATAQCRSHILRKGHMVFDLPIDQAWHFILAKDLTYGQYHIEVKPKSCEWVPGKYKLVLPPRVKLEVITQLTACEEEPVSGFSTVSQEVREDSELEAASERTLDELREALTEAYNLWVEGSLSEDEIDDVMSHLVLIRDDIDSLSQILKR